MSYSLAGSLLLIAAVALGSALVYVGLNHKRRLPVMGVLHALLAIASVLVLSMTIATGPSNKLINVAVFFLVLALIGGAMVFMLHEKGRPPSMPMVTMHAIMGLVALVLVSINLAHA